jgi:pre-rRNA-processing protein TSR3
MNEIFYVYLNQDDPKKSTMKKLERYGLAIQIPLKKIYNKLYLTPFSENFLLNSHRQLFEDKGIVILDGSWNRIGTIENLTEKNGKKLPLLLPVNPVNYGKPGKLSSLEGLAAALYIMGYSELADIVISKYSWAQNFIRTNMDPLNDYSKCNSNEDCIEAQNNYF